MSTAAPLSETSRRKLALVCGLGVVVALAFFLRSFDWHEPQYSDALWFGAIVLWAAAVCLWPPQKDTAWPWRAGDFLPLLIFLPIFAAVWLPFYDDWRWAFTGDSFGIFTVGYWFGKDGPPDSLLSVHGIDNFYTRLWELGYNWLMWVVEPTLFWHRVGQLLMACLGLSSIFAFYCLVLGRWWALAIVLATATNYLFVWISFISYQRTDSFVFYYLTLIAGLLLWRTPERLGVWLLAGLTGGLSTLFTPVVWGAVGWVALIFGSIALLRRRFAGVAVYAVSFLLTSMPIWLELPWMIEMLQKQAIAQDAQSAVVLPSVAYLWGVFRTIVWSGFDSPIHQLGAAGAFLRFPLGHLYVGGLALAAVACVPWLRRRLRLPATAPVLLLLLLADAALFAVTNKGYGLPSHKRFYNLIPLQVFFAVLPLYTANVWLRAYDRLRLIPLLTTAAIACAAYIGLDLIRHPAPHIYGHNTFDGLIEIRQRLPDFDVVLFSRRPIGQDLAPGSLFDQAYGISQRLTLTSTLTREELPDLCQRHVLLCHETISVADDMAALMAGQQHWQEVKLLNSFEVRCHRCP